MNPTYPQPPATTTPTPAPGYSQPPTPPAYPPAVPGLARATAGQPMTNVMDTLRKQCADATISDQRRGMPLGTAIYIVNDVTYKVTPTNNIPLDSIMLTCAVPITDSMGLKYGEQGYSGSIPGTQYEYVIFRNSKYGGHMRQWLDLVKCFLGLTPDKIKEYQKTDQGIDYLLQLIQVLIGYDFNTNQSTQSCLANMNACEIATVQRMVDDKNKQTGQPNYDQNGQKIQKAVVNTYFNKHVLLADLYPMFTGQEATLFQYFGGQENFNRAYAAQNPTA